MTIPSNAPQGAPKTLSREQIIAHIKQEVANIWKRNPLSAEIQQRIDNGQPLSHLQVSAFIITENANIRAIRDQFPGIIAKLAEIEPNLLTTLVGGEHQSRELLRSNGVNKFLLAVDEKEQFYIDLFYFPPKTRTEKHNHNAHCISYQLEGNLREVVYKEHSPTHQLVEFKPKPPGHSTVVSPYGDHDDIHAINNDTSKPAATIHVYAQRVVGKDNVVTTNRSSAPAGPTSVVKYLSGHKGYELAVQPKTLAERITEITQAPRNFLQHAFRNTEATQLSA